MSKYLCMDDDELEGWLRAARQVHNGGRNPCVDCPMSYHLAMKAEGRCDRIPLETGRPIIPSEDPETNARRAMWRRADRRRRGLVAA